MKKKGFTLLELAITIAIVAIVGLAVYPNITAMFQDADAELIRSIASDTEMAVSEGIDRQITIGDLRDSRLVNVVQAINTHSSPDIAIAAGSTGNINVTLFPGNTAKEKTAVISIGNDGQVTITSCADFTGYSCSTGDLIRN